MNRPRPVPGTGQARNAPSAPSEAAVPTEPPRRRAWRWWLVGAALALVVVATIIALVLSRPQTLGLDVTAPVPAHPNQLLVGHCLKAIPPAQNVGTVVVVPCGTAHRAEVIAAVPLAHGGSAPARRPATNRLAQRTETACADVTFDGAPPEAKYAAWLPTKQSWKRGDHRALCLIEATTLVGSVLP